MRFLSCFKTNKGQLFFGEGGGAQKPPNTFFVVYRIGVMKIHYDLKVSRSQAKIDENFANYFLKTKANKCFIVLKITCIGLQKSIIELER